MQDAKQVRPLSVPTTQSVRYQRNFIKTAVCELRFPTLLELNERLPPELQKALRKEYPFFQPETGYDLSIGGGVPIDKRYLLNSRERTWLVSITQSRISLETVKYTEFREFYSRLARILDVAARFIDSDFFTRIGLRYINAIPLADDDVTGWINPELVTALVSGYFGTVSHFQCEVAGDIAHGKYTFRYGLQPNTAGQDAQLKYVLDYDYYAENIEAKDVLSTVKSFNKANFSFFHWCLGPKALQALGKSMKKSQD